MIGYVVQVAVGVWKLIVYRRVELAGLEGLDAYHRLQGARSPSACPIIDLVELIGTL